MLVAASESAGPSGLSEDLLEDEEGVDEHERRLEEVHREHRDLEVFAVIAGQLELLAVVDEVDPAVPGFDDLAGLVDFAVLGFRG